MRAVLVLVVALASFTVACSNRGRPARMAIEAAPRAATPAAIGERMRVVTYNVHMIDGDAIARAIEADAALASADVLILQEVRRDGGETSEGCVAARALDLDCAYAPGHGVDRGGDHGVAILSRGRLADLAVIELPFISTVFNSGRRVALGATIDAAGTSVRLYAVHLDNRINPKDRKHQIAPVLDDARRRDLPTVIAGDMNTNPFVWLGHVIPLPAGVQDNRLERFVRERGFATPLVDSGPTHQYLGMRLDAIYTRGIDVLGHDVVHEVRASDHLPMWADVAVADAAQRIRVANTRTPTD
jgi:endonuclease/exonuclease/phosphatase family metal-dependent hydrolase